MTFKLILLGLEGAEQDLIGVPRGQTTDAEVHLGRS